MLHVALNGLVPPEQRPVGRVEIDLREAPSGPPTRQVAMHDARPLQTAVASESDFFADHGFVLLPHASAVREIGRIYVGEIETIIRERLLPGRRLLVWQYPVPVRRGEGMSTPQYGTGVHQDHALAADDYQCNVTAFAGEQAGSGWRWRYDQPDVEGFMAINFWRTTNMPAPLEHLPLAVCDPGSVEAGDIVQFAMRGIAPEGRTTHQMGLRYSADHLWYYYPRMTRDELLAFKIFQCMKSDPAPRLYTCFHSAFEHPEAAEDAPRRQSCEHRVSVFLLNDDC
jgi:hypothetical protein